jgi:endonuclease G
MLEIPSLRPETRYGIPTSDMLLFNRQFIVGYSFLFRQPRWAMQVIDDRTKRMADGQFDRLDNFREDLRVPDKFRSTLADYRGSKHDRGHLINSADRKGRHIVNSETFLMSNISPQKPKFNRKIWLDLEDAVRVLADKQQYVEVYTICGPLFKIGDPIDVIGKNQVVVPDAFFKCVLAEKAKPNAQNQLEMWTFAIPNEESSQPLASFLVTTEEVERRAGLQIWISVQGGLSPIYVAI